MADKNEEILRIVKEKKIWRILLPYPAQNYKEKKKEYFSDLLQKGFGIPKDQEIANAVLNYFFRISYFKNKDHLNEMLQTPFFSKNIVKELFLKEYRKYLDKLNDTELTKSKGELDLGLIDKLDHKTRIEEPREEFKDTTQEVDQKKDIAPQIEDNRNEAEATPESDKSLPNQVDIPERVPLQEIRGTQRRHEPWWKTLALSSDPFPVSGLGNIKDSLYDRIIVMTKIYEEYDYYINNVPDELFKNIVLYGEYGSGKTTLFQYLKILLFKKRYIRLL